MTQTLEEFEALNKVGDEMLWKTAAINQIAGFKELREAVVQASGCYVSDNVINTHTSKSIRLPVVEFTIPSTGLTLTMRNNFYDIKVSVNSSKPIEDREFGNWVDTKAVDGYYNFEGFPRDKVYGPYDENPSQFSVSIGRDNLKAFVEAVASQAKSRGEVDSQVAETVAAQRGNSQQQQQQT